MGTERNYLPAQLKWCLDKDLLQQTLTLIESVMIESLINEGIVSYPNGLEDVKKLLITGLTCHCLNLNVMTRLGW